MRGDEFRYSGCKITKDGTSYEGTLQEEKLIRIQEEVFKLYELSAVLY